MAWLGPGGSTRLVACAANGGQLVHALSVALDQGHGPGAEPAVRCAAAALEGMARQKAGEHVIVGISAPPACRPGNLAAGQRCVLELQEVLAQLVPRRQRPRARRPRSPRSSRRSSPGASAGMRREARPRAWCTQSRERVVQRLDRDATVVEVGARRGQGARAASAERWAGGSLGALKVMCGAGPAGRAAGLAGGGRSDRLREAREARRAEIDEGEQTGKAVPVPGLETRRGQPRRAAPVIRPRLVLCVRRLRWTRRTSWR